MDEGDVDAAAAAAKISPGCGARAKFAASPEISDFDEHTVACMCPPAGRRSLPRVQPVQARQEEVGIDRGARVGRRATRARGCVGRGDRIPAAAGRRHDSLPYMEPEHWYAKPCSAKRSPRRKPRTPHVAGELRTRGRTTRGEEGERRARERVEAGDDVSRRRARTGPLRVSEVFRTPRPEILQYRTQSVRLGGDKRRRPRRPSASPHQPRTAKTRSGRKDALRVDDGVSCHRVRGGDRLPRAARGVAARRGAGAATGSGR